MAPKILVLLASTRQGRMGERIARWFLPIAERREDLAVEPTDLRDWKLPYYDEPMSPSRGPYPENVKPWAEHIGAADGFIVVTPEYNYGYPAVLKSAMDAIYREWNRKPIAFVSYGGWAAGTRSVQQLRLVAIELQMVPVRHTIAFQFAGRLLDAEGRLQNAEFYERAANTMLDELAWWAALLKEAGGRTGA